MWEWNANSPLRFILCRNLSRSFSANPSPASKPGLIYIMVDGVAAILDLIVANGGEVAQPIDADAPEITARFRDSAREMSSGSTRTAA